MKNIILCDIDGTVANNDHRQHFLEGKKDWDGFFSELINDKPIYKIINKVNNAYLAGKEIIFLTGRPERYRYSTLLWLSEYFNFEPLLLMRNNKDLRTKIDAKKQIFYSNLNTEEIDYILENDEDLIKMWNEMGLSVVNINNILKDDS
jgi:hydroxymethylpyrimidine pyrophosphatase-like HAD family hydrolase|tara:strand:- start:893 stop:1336 length:444 start_codon:yes stop_codon:yes gene_type:complete